jgi:enoyl-CoA hydratase/carnithine racemase
VSVLSRLKTNSTLLNVDKSNKQCWRVTIDNPPINLLTPELVIGLHQLVGQMEVDPDLRVVVFDSANADFFVNHFDSSRTVDLPTTPGPTGLPMLLDFFIRLSLAPVVTIALIGGRTRGGGMEFALACDMKFASTEKAVFGQPEVGNGNLPGGGGLERLPGLIGRGRALEVVLGCNDFDDRPITMGLLTGHCLITRSTISSMTWPGVCACSIVKRYAPRSARLTGTRCR